MKKPILKKPMKKTRSQKKKILKLELIVLAVLLVCLGLSLYRYFSIRPGWVEASSIEAVKRTASSIEISWSEARNAVKYETVWTEKDNADAEPISVISETTTAKATGLKQGTEYKVRIRAYAEDDIEGIYSGSKVFATKSKQKLTAKSKYLKLTSSKSFNIAKGAKSETECSSSNQRVATVTNAGKVKIRGAGTATLRVEAKADENYLRASKTIRLEVISSLERNSNGGSFGVVYNIGPSDVKTVMTVSGEGGAATPQSMGFTGKKYIIVFGDEGSQRIISYNLDGSGRKVSVPSHNLGHPNGFTYCNKTKLCYCVRGFTTSIDTYNPKNGAYGKTSMPYQAAGICYDRVTGKMLTTSRTGIRVYKGDGSFVQEKLIYDISRPMHVYTQDSCAHAGFVFRCMSGANKHAENYIDMFRVSDSKYLGSIRVSGLGELESAIVDNEGYLELLVNSSVDRIYKTKIKVRDLK